MGFLEEKENKKKQQQYQHRFLHLSNTQMREVTVVMQKFPQVATRSHNGLEHELGPKFSTFQPSLA